MSIAGRDAAPALDPRRNPFGTTAEVSDSQATSTIADAVRRTRWIAIDIRAIEFGLFSVSPSMERARLLSCFDSDFPRVSMSTKFASGQIGEEIVRHARRSTTPCWWSDAMRCLSETSFARLAFARRVPELVPSNPGIAFPVFADRGQCGVVAFFGRDMALSNETMPDIHARCFGLFDAVSRIRGNDGAQAPAVSKRELECLKLTANGLTSEQIAVALRLSVHTANQYLTNSAQKLNAVNRMHAVAKALKLGLFE